MKNKNVAALLSLLFPGLGHLYIGKYVDAVGLIIGSGVLWYAFYMRGYYYLTIASAVNPRGYLFVGSLLFVYILAIVDAYRKTK